VCKGLGVGRSTLYREITRYQQAEKQRMDAFDAKVTDAVRQAGG
jgi:hypothetical protein